MRKPKGFTLIELLVVIAIIALLLAILMPSLKMAKEHGKRLICGTNMKTIGTALAIYAAQEDDDLPMNFYQHKSLRPKHSTPGAGYFLGEYDGALHNASAGERLTSLISSGRFTGYYGEEDRARNLGYLMKERLIEASPEIVYCPSNRTKGFSYESYGGDDDWPRGGGGGSNPYQTRTSFCYLPQSRTKKHPGNSVLPGGIYPNAAYKYSKMAPSRSVVMDLLIGGDMAHRSGSYVGVNILFGDGSVVFKRDEDGVIKSDTSLLIDHVKFREAIKALER